MIETLALLLCDAIAIDPGGKITLYGIFDIIFAKQVPTRHPQFSVFVKCRFSQAGEVQLLILKPDGTPLMQIDPLRVDQPGVAQMAYGFGGVEFPVTGVYPMHLVAPGGQIVGRSALEVRLQQ